MDLNGFDSLGLILYVLYYGTKLDKSIGLWDAIQLYNCEWISLVQYKSKRHEVCILVLH